MISVDDWLSESVITSISLIDESKCANIWQLCEMWQTHLFYFDIIRVTYSYIVTLGISNKSDSPLIPMYEFICTSQL